MTAPYYADERVTLYHGRCEDILPTLAPASASVLLTDPPYFQVKDDDWDNQWDHADEFLAWLGGVMDATEPLLMPSATAWMFANPILTSRVEREVIAPRLRVLNSIRWVKEAGWHRRTEIEAQRCYRAAWEGLLLAERRSDPAADAAFALYRRASKDAHAKAFAPLGDYIRSERERHGISRAELELALGYASTADPTKGTALVTRWEEGDGLPTARVYQRMRELLGEGYFAREYEDLQAEAAQLRDVYLASRGEFDHLRLAYEETRRQFRLRQGGPVTDVWDFPPVMAYPGKHPCEKPLSMLNHMIEVSSRPGDLILDPFAGSGSTLRAAKDLRRRAIGIESDERWCEQAARRLGQEAFQLEWPA
jgi:adenine-specific DNA-methyltransferase